MQDKECSRCKNIKNINQFHKNGNKHRSECKECSLLHMVEYYNTEKGYFIKILNSAKIAAKERKEKGRVQAGSFDITLNCIKDIWIKQNNKCYYSGILMQTKTNSNWQCSIERINIDLGYTTDNVVLCCLEFNGCCQWNLHKIKEIIEIKKNYNTIYRKVDFTIPIKTRKKVSIDLLTKIINNIEFRICINCQVCKHPTNFNKTYKYTCKDCQKSYNKSYRESNRGHLVCLLKGARYHCKRVKSKKINFDLDIDFLVELFHKQKGLCYYSGLPLAVGQRSNDNWRCSIERLNSYGDYTRDNVVFIAWEFNTGVKKSIDNDGCGWNKEKFNTFYQSILTEEIHNITDVLSKIAI